MAVTEHHHHPPSGGRSLVLGLLLTTGFAIVEAVTGWLANSLALLGDAGHMLTDSLSLAVGALAAWASKRGVTERLSFGWQRAEVLGALFNVLFMYLVVAFIVVASVGRLMAPEPIVASSVLVVGSIGLLVNIAVAWILQRGEQTLNTRGALLHVLGDLLGSVAAIGAAVVVMLTGWLPIDPLLSLFVCALILVSSTRLMIESVRVVLAGVPASIDPRGVAAAMRAAHNNVVGVHHLHIWSVSSRTTALSAHVRIERFDHWPETLQALVRSLHDEFEIDHPTLQPEQVCGDQVPNQCLQ